MRELGRYAAPLSTPITSVNQLRYSGPLADALMWRTYESMYTASTPIFDGVDAHLAPAFIYSMNTALRLHA